MSRSWENDIYAWNGGALENGVVGVLFTSRSLESILRIVHASMSGSLISRYSASTRFASLLRLSVMIVNVGDSRMVYVVFLGSSS